MIKTNFKYEVKYSILFKKQYKKVKKQNKNISKLKYIIEQLANGEVLETRYHDHQLLDDKRYTGCRECHIEPDWLLVYKYCDDELILLLVSTGSHSNIFK